MVDRATLLAGLLERAIGEGEWTVLDHAYKAIGSWGPDDWTLPAWREVANLKHTELERILRFCGKEDR